MTRLSSKPAVRRIRTSSRSITGATSLEDGAASFESALERDWLTCLDFNAEVIELGEQPFRLTYEVNGAVCRYTPDVLAVFQRGYQPPITRVYEVKYANELRKEWHRYEPRFRAAYRYCMEKGWHFHIVNERHIRTPFLKNAQFFRRYRALDLDPNHATCLLQTMRLLGGESTPEELLLATYHSHENRMWAMPSLWQLIANYEIGTDLNQEVMMNSQIWLDDL